jgi:hypothetical protein
MTEMTETTNPNIHWASVDPRFLQKVDRVFDASPTTVWVELLQNARRAGATRVTVHLTEGEDGCAACVVCADNGKGLESPAPLLRLAGRGWSDEVEHEEDPAGMGFFCLSNIPSVWVNSCDWTAEFTPAAFRGEVGVEQLKISPLDGFSVEFAWESQKVVNLSAALMEAAQFCGIQEVSVQIDDRPATVIEPKDFLHDTQMPVREVPELGVRIGARHLLAYRYDDHVRVTLNFRGVSITWGSADLGEIIPKLRHCHVEVQVDVLHTRVLQLVLPARNAVKHNSGRDALLEEIERTIYQWLIVRQTVDPKNTHDLPYALYRRAKERFGLVIEEAGFNLTAYGDADYTGREHTRVLIDPATRAWTFLKYLIGEHNATVDPDACINAYRTRDEMRGYAWYDSIPLLLGAVVKIDGKEIAQEDLSDQLGKAQHQLADNIEVALHMSDARTITINPDVIVLGDTKFSSWSSAMDENSVYLRATIKTEPDRIDDVARTLTAELFEAYTEGDGDSIEDQEREFLRDATVWLFEFCGQIKRALRYRVNAVIDDIDWVARNEGVVWTLRHDGRKGSRYNDNRIELRSFQLSADEDANHKMVSIHKDGKAGRIEELVSEQPVTLERVRAYLAKEHGIDAANDQWFGDVVRSAVDLDAWEKQQ